MNFALYESIVRVPIRSIFYTKIFCSTAIIRELDSQGPSTSRIAFCSILPHHVGLVIGAQLVTAKTHTVHTV